MKTVIGLLISFAVIIASYFVTRKATGRDLGMDNVNKYVVTPVSNYVSSLLHTEKSTTNMVV